MQKVTVIMSRNDRLVFIQKLQAQYNIPLKHVDAVRNISIGGIGYLVIPVANNDYLRLEFLSDNTSRYGNLKLLEKYMKNVDGVVISDVVPELFKPYLREELIEFKFNHDIAIADFIETIIATQTMDQAIALTEAQPAPIASPSVIASLYGLFKVGQSTSANKLNVGYKSQSGVQHWQNESVVNDAEISGATYKLHGGQGNDDL